MEKVAHRGRSPGRTLAARAGRAALLVLLLLLLSPVAQVHAEDPPGIAWARQFGAPYGAGAIAVDSSGVYVAFTADTVSLRKYDASGAELWTRQFGAASNAPFDLAADSSGVYVVGSSLVRKYNVSGDEVWSGTVALSGASAAAVAVDSSSVYVAGTYGTAFNAFVRKYTVNGAEVWTQQFAGMTGIFMESISATSSGAYMAGSISQGALPGQTSMGNGDAFVIKYDSDGNEVWTRQFGTTATDHGLAVRADSSGVYVVGTTLGAFTGYTNAEGYDTFVRKYDADGVEVWTRQFATGYWAPYPPSLSLNSGGVYVAGSVYGALPGQTGAGAWDAFIRKYDTDGNEVWTRQFGTQSDDLAPAVAVDAGGAYVAGFTQGAFAGTETNGVYAFVMKLAGSNRPPVLSSIGSKTVDEGQELSFTVSATDPDGDALTYAASGLTGTGLPSGATLNATTRTFSWTPGYDQSGTHYVSFFVSDGAVSDYEPIAITVNNVAANNAPVLSAIGAKTVDEGQALSFTLSATDADGDALTYSAASQPSGAMFNAGTSTFSWSPGYDQSGSYQMTFTVSDGTATDSETVTVTVNNATPPSGGEGGGGTGGGSSSTPVRAGRGLPDPAGWTLILSGLAFLALGAVIFRRKRIR